MTERASPPPGADETVERRRRTVERILGDGPGRGRMATAPAWYVLVHDPADIARHCALLDPAPMAGVARVAVTPGGSAGRWQVDVVSRDRPGLLATCAAGLAAAGLDAVQAVAASWPDGTGLRTFIAEGRSSPGPPGTCVLEAALAKALGWPLLPAAAPEAEIRFGDSLWAGFTPCTVRAPARPRLLTDLAAAIALAGVRVHAATVAPDANTNASVATFDLSDRRDRPLPVAAQAAVTDAIRAGAGPAVVFTRQAPPGNSLETLLRESRG